jgi:hypothetical protein
MGDTLKEKFDELGFAVAEILSPEECAELVPRLRNHGASPTCGKGSAATWRAFYENDVHIADWRDEWSVHFVESYP